LSVNNEKEINVLLVPAYLSYFIKVTTYLYMYLYILKLKFIF
jgi:hypothetical protein